ncbi:hypothetical protein PDK35_07100 [Bacillus cereus group sp. TH153LC]|uniref:hypothetical protein n=1 Tax=Bacillus cereus group sp. TH153LC TaxID=3018059 RepID=UPI0022E48ADF|nr:hypothetical protein [Bacillus cereus group sp. TH153LC]MDA1659737.1 hypothetical protein [Bacillus cereus group sp. TH153LC]
MEMTQIFIGVYNVVLIVVVLAIMLKKKQYKVVMVLVVSLIYIFIATFTPYRAFFSNTMNVLIIISLMISGILASIFEKEK